MTEAGFSKSEMMIVAAARELAGQGVVFSVGVGLPNIAVNLAKRTVNPKLHVVYEAGAFGARPARLPLSIGDPDHRDRRHRRRLDVRAVRVLPAARPDRRRLPGRGPDRQVREHQHDGHRRLRGPEDAAAGVGRRLRDRDQRPQRVRDHAPVVAAVVERIDFRTSPGNLGGAEQAEAIRRAGGWNGRGPSVVVTDLGIWHFDESGEMRLDSLHPGATLDDVRATIAWQPKVSAALAETPPPSAEELRLVREELDPEGVYTR